MANVFCTLKASRTIGAKYAWLDNYGIIHLEAADSCPNLFYDSRKLVA
jgi:hypothetical protein